MQADVAYRTEFETMIRLPPFNKDATRHSDSTSGYSIGEYIDASVQLAFDVWVQAKAKLDQESARKEGEVFIPGGNGLLHAWSKENDILDHGSLDEVYSQQIELKNLRVNYRLAHEHIELLTQQIKSMRARGHRLLLDPFYKESRTRLDHIIAELTLGEIECKKCGSKEETIALPCVDDLEKLRKFLVDSPNPENLDTTFQSRVKPWLIECFGEDIANDKQERNHRLLEEVLEANQSCGCTASEAHQLVDYVFSRPIGEPYQEVGGVMVTLAAFCLANDLNMHDCGELELARIWTKIDLIREKQRSKPSMSPLPGVYPERRLQNNSSESAK